MQRVSFGLGVEISCVGAVNVSIINSFTTKILSIRVTCQFFLLKLTLVKVMRLKINIQRSACASNNGDEVKKYQICANL